MRPPEETIPDDQESGQASAPALLNSGDVLSERYEIQSLLGQGGMGTVYRAQDRHLGLAVALKTLVPGTPPGERAIRRLKREVLLSRQVSHPNVCRLHDLNWDEGHQMFFATMELLVGETLAERLKRGGAMDPAEALPLAEQMARGLDAAHAAGVVHRDFKSANVMLVSDPAGDRAVLTDFGIARPFTGDNVQVTRTGQVVGTPGYMAPEQRLGESASPAADIYAFGVVLYEMVAGRLPFEESETVVISRGDGEQALPSSIRHGKDLPESWAQATRRCLERDPRERFASAGLVVAALKGRGDSAAREEHARGNLPAERDVFVGREEDLHELMDRFAGGARLVSVLGIGGSGKTRLALQLARQQSGSWSGGTWFCDLSEARSKYGIAHAVATALGVPLGTEDPALQLGHAIRGRGQCLVILDNFEQVARHAAETLGRWLDVAPNAQFLSTSREMLGLPGENAFNLSPLAASDAVALFMDRAAAAKRGFAPTDGDREACAELVELLDLLPLAIEIAAARVAMLSPRQILERAEDRFRLLTTSGQRRDRRATLRATLDWSWDLLNEEEQTALAQLSVFEGGFTVEAAEAVLEPGEMWPVDALQSLVNKSLVQPGKEDRFDLLVTVQEYAAERLRERGGIDAAQRRHGAYFAGYGTAEALETLDSPGGEARRKRLALELDNLVAACRRAIERKDGATATATFLAAWAVLMLQGPFRVGVELGLQVRDIDGVEPRERAQCLVAVGRASWSSGEMSQAEETLEQALQISRTLPDRAHEGKVLDVLGIVHMRQGRMEEAKECYEQVLRIASDLGDRRLESGVRNNLGLLNLDLGNLDEARADLEQALASARQLGHRRFEAAALNNLGNVHLAQGSLEEARERYSEGLRLNRDLGNRRFEAHVLSSLARLHFLQGRLGQARECDEAALRIQQTIGDRSAEGGVLNNLAILDMAEEKLEQAQDRLERALAIDREVGNRHFEGIVLGNLGTLFRKQEKVDEAREQFEKALAIHREVGNRQTEGSVLGKIGELHLEQGNMEEAGAAFRRGEKILREVGDRVKLALLLCHRAAFDLRASRFDAARSALEEASRLAGETGVGEDSELGVAVRELRDAIEKADPA